MSSPAIDERKRLIEHLVDRVADYAINDVPPPGDVDVGPLAVEQVCDQWARLADEHLRGDLVGHYANVYLHVPFCRSKCSYCMYDSRSLRSPELLGAYVEQVRQEVDRLSEGISSLVFQNLHVGGGTPTILDESLLLRLLGTVFDSIRFRADGSKVIETNPEAITPSKADLLVRHGFNKISVGVQSLDPEVLALHGRAHQSTADVRSALRYLRQAEAPYVNCDFMIGLAGDRRDTFLEGLGALFDFGPDSVMLAKLQPQWGYLRRHFAGSYERYAERFEAEFGPAVESALRLAERAGYETDNPRPSDVGWRFWRRGFRPPYDERRPYYCTGGELPCSTLGIGRFAKSHVFGRLLYEHRGRRSDQPAGSCYRGFAVTRRHEAARFVIAQVAARRELDPGQFHRHFGTTPDEIFPGLLEALQAVGDVQRQGGRYRFLPRSTRELFVLSRLFVDRRAVLRELAKGDRAAIDVRFGADRLRFVVERLAGPPGEHVAVEGDLGLRLEAECGSIRPATKLLVGLLLGRFRRAARRHPDWPATAVATAMRRRLRAALAKLPSVVGGTAGEVDDVAEGKEGTASGGGR